jgi:hypothetical protein
MTVYDLELISVSVEDADISSLMSLSRQQLLADSIELDRQKGKLVLVSGQEDAKRSIASELASTQELLDTLDRAHTNRTADNALAVVHSDNEKTLLKKKGEQEAAIVVAEIQALSLGTAKAREELDEQYAEAELIRTVKLLSEEAACSKARYGSGHAGACRGSGGQCECWNIREGHTPSGSAGIRQ